MFSHIWTSCLRKDDNLDRMNFTPRNLLKTQSLKTLSALIKQSHGHYYLVIAINFKSSFYKKLLKVFESSLKKKTNNNDKVETNDNFRLLS